MASHRAQRGAVTLIAALFILVVLSVMAVALLRMAGSNILDSAVHNDAVEALFIAETGIEHASYQYARTGSCTKLSNIRSVHVGRGHFSLTHAAVQPGNVCRIRVTARAGSTANNPAMPRFSLRSRLSSSRSSTVST